MNRSSLWLAVPLATIMLLTGCASSPSKNDQLEKTRAELETLKGDKSVQAHSATALLDAEQALKRADDAHEKDDKTSRNHYHYLANRYLEIAKAMAETGLVQQDTRAMGEERERLAIAGREAQIAEQQSELAARQSELQQEQARSRELEAELSALEAKRTERGMLLTLDDVFFETAGAKIAPGANRSLDKVVTFLKNNPDQNIVIEGHTDSVGEADYNQRLSEQRAESVKQEILSRGIAADRLMARGYGESRPVASNANPAGRQLNRRVEIIFPNNNGK